MLRTLSDGIPRGRVIHARQNGKREDGRRQRRAQPNCEACSRTAVLYRVVFVRIETPAFAATARSGLPSRLKSATASVWGAFATAKFIAG